MHSNFVPPLSSLLFILATITTSAPLPLTPTALSSMTASPFSKSSKFISQSQQAPHSSPKKLLKTSTTSTFLDLDEDFNQHASDTESNIENVVGNMEAINPDSWDDYSYTYKFNGADGTTTTTTRTNQNGHGSGVESDSEGENVTSVGGKNRNRKDEVQGFELDTDKIVNTAIFGDKKKGEKVGDVLRAWLPQGGRGLAKVEKVEERVSYDGVKEGYEEINTMMGWTEDQDVTLNDIASKAEQVGMEGYAGVAGYGGQGYVSKDGYGSQGQEGYEDKESYESQEGYESQNGYESQGSYESMGDRQSQENYENTTAQGGYESQGCKEGEGMEKPRCGMAEDSKYMDSKYMNSGYLSDGDREMFKDGDPEDIYEIGIADRNRAE